MGRSAQTEGNGLLSGCHHVFLITRVFFVRVCLLWPHGCLEHPEWKPLQESALLHLLLHEEYQGPDGCQRANSLQPLPNNGARSLINVRPSQYMETSVLIFFSPILYCKYFPFAVFQYSPTWCFSNVWPSFNFPKCCRYNLSQPLCVYKDKETSNNLVDLITHRAGCRRVPSDCHTSTHLQDFPKVHFVKMT